MPTSHSQPAPQRNGFHHVAIRVVDFDRAVSFYRDLDFRPARAWGTAPKRAVMLDRGDGVFLEIFEGGAADTPAEGRIIHFALRTDDCDALHARALAAGGRETLAPKDVTLPTQPTPTPIRISFFEAPTGEIVECFQEKCGQ